MTNESNGSLINEVMKHLEVKDYASAISIFNNVKHQEYLKNNSWDLIPVLGRHITKEARSKNIEMANCCERLLEKLAKEANPEEAVLEFLDQMDEADYEKFDVVLKLLKIVLFREMENREKSLEWTLNSIRSYMEQYSYNDESENVSDGSDEFYNSDKIKEIEYVTSSAIQFFEEFITEFNQRPHSEELRYLLASRLIQTFDVFLPYINTELYPQCRVLQSKICQLILQLVSNPMSLLEFVFYRALNVMKPKIHNSSKEIRKLTKDYDICREDITEPTDCGEKLNPFEDETIVSNLAYGMFFYSLLTESENEQAKLPLVYNPKYIMLSLIYVTVPFFNKKTDTAIRNGLNFLQLLLSQLNDCLTKSDLYFSTHKTILVHLNNFMIFSEVEENRKLALKCFKSYIESFNWEARYLLMLNLRRYIHHSGTLGFLIGLLKEFVSNFLELPTSSQQNKKFLKYYKGKLLFDLIKKYCYLSDGTNTDLVENADHIVSSLNVLRYLVLRDKKNVTDIKNFIKRIDKDFLIPLKENIKSSKQFYDLKIKELDTSESKSSIASTESDVEIELAVKGQTLPKLTKEQQKTAYQSCLNAVDLIDSLHISNTFNIKWRDLQQQELPRSLKNTVRAIILSNSHIYSLNLSVRVPYALRRHCSSKEDPHNTEKDADDQQYENNIREKILNASLPFVQKHGWSKEAIASGAEVVGYPGITNGIFPNGGADLINHFYIQCNQKLKDHMVEVTAKSEKPIKPKEFIRNSIEVRLRMLIPYIDQWPQAIAIMSLPPNVPVALANLLTLVDDICFYAGDKSVDFNWYTRRIGIGGLYKMSELYMLQDKSLDYKETWHFLDRRLGEAFQIQQVLSSSSGATTVAKDVVTSAFITARNILRLNIPR